jgi:hypothetical protein
MKNLLILIAIFVVTTFSIQAQSRAAKNSDWKTITGCNLTLSVPVDVDFTKDYSVDTCEREYRSRNIHIQMTVTEWNIGADQYSNLLDYCLTKTKINAKPAEIITSYKPKISENDLYENSGFDYTAMLLLPSFVKGNRNLVIRTFSKTSEDRDKAMKILKSVQPDNE